MTTEAIDPRAAEVLDFWFGRRGEPGHLQPREQWFRKDAQFDAQIAQRFGALIAEALRGGLAQWAVQPLSALAQIVVLDPFTRNAHRDSAAMFAGDARALIAARALVDSGADRTLPGVMRQFAYLPFEHAEDLAEQQRALALFTQLEADEPALAGLLEWARKHHQIIERFGRFPHRNALLGRASTPEEVEFLRQPGSSF